MIRTDPPVTEAALSEEIPAALDGERVDRAVSIVTGCPRSDAAGLIREGKVLLDGVVVSKPSVRLVSGQRLDLLSLPEQPDDTVHADPTVDVPVVHLDDEFIVVDKPPGLVVHPGAGHSDATLVHGLLARFPELADVGEPLRPGLVHRLDRWTSGLLVVARTPEAYDELVYQLQHHTVTRIYTALTWGHFDHRHGVIDAPVGRSRRDPTRMTVALDGREARTHFDVEHEFDTPVEASLVTCELETGRTHQIRVHLASIGHGVIGDEVYGGVRHSYQIPRPFLHARHLEFLHPATGELVAFDSPLPADLVEVLDGFS